MSTHGERAPRDWASLAILAFAALGAGLARVLELVALEDVPHVMDEIAYTIQARTFASGHLTTALHLPRAAFALWFVDDRERFFSIFPPGWPAVLSLGYLTGLAAWVNPLLHGATTLLVSRSARLLSGRRASVIAAGLYALSPQAILLAASLMSHTLVALAAAAVLAVALQMISTEAPARRWMLASAGAAVGLTVATRPLCGVVLAVNLAIFTTIGLRRRTLRPMNLAVIGAPVFVLLALLAMYNAELTGSALRFPQSVFFDEHIPPINVPLFDYHPGCNSLGFGPGHGCETTMAGGMHSLANAASNLGDNMTAWFWLAGGGPLAFGLALLALAQRRGRGWSERLATFAAIPLAVALYGLYWYAGTCYGARFYHVALPALLVLAAVGLERLAVWRARAFEVSAAILVWNCGVGVPAAAEISGSYWGTDARFARLAHAWKEPPALVLVAFAPEELRSSHSLTTFMKDVPWFNNIRALAALAVNRPDLSGPVLFARYHPGLMPELRLRFPDRKLVLYVVHAKASADRVVPYETSGLVPLESSQHAPPDNFDGFVVPGGLFP